MFQEMSGAQKHENPSRADTICGSKATILTIVSVIFRAKAFLVLRSQMLGFCTFLSHFLSQLIVKVSPWALGICVGYFSLFADILRYSD